MSVCFILAWIVLFPLIWLWFLLQWYPDERPFIIFFLFLAPCFMSDLNSLLPVADLEDYLSPLPEPSASGSVLLQLMFTLWPCVNFQCVSYLFGFIFNPFCIHNLQTKLQILHLKFSFIYKISEETTSSFGFTDCNSVFVGNKLDKCVSLLSTVWATCSTVKSAQQISRKAYSFVFQLSPLNGNSCFHNIWNWQQFQVILFIHARAASSSLMLCSHVNKHHLV